MKFNRYLAIAKVGLFLNGIEDYGITEDQLLKVADINPLLFEAPDNRLPLEKVNLLFNTAADLTNEPLIGLKQGLRLTRGFSNILGYILMNCTNLGEAASKYCCYERIVDSTNEYRIVTDGNNLVLELIEDDGWERIAGTVIDFKLAGMVAYAKLLTGKSFKVKAVNLVRQNATFIEQYQQYFGCPVNLGQSRNSLVFDKEVFALPIIAPNLRLKEQFERIAFDSLKQDGDQDYTVKVAQAIVTRLTGGSFSIKDIAVTLTMSVRNLQLNLKNEGTSYIQILNEVRKNRSVELLQDNHVSVAEIAYLLGFSETRSFERAFKRWTGLSPAKYRATLKRDKKDADRRSNC